MTNKILFISHDINHTGFGQVTKNILNALREKFDVVSRSIAFQKPHQYSWHNEMKEKSLDGVTHVIQYVLPHFLERFPGVHNIAMVEIENNNLEHCPWIEYYSMMDEVWTSNYEAQQELEKFLFPNIPVKTVFHPLDTSIYHSDYPKLNLPEEVDGYFKFYFIGYNNLRKNIAGLIKAFYLEFNKSEPVSLIIKTNNNIEDLCEGIKKSIKLYANDDWYPSTVFISENMTDEEIYALHNACDCYVSSSSGESWGQPLYDSQGFGNPAVFTKLGGHLELIKTNYLNEDYKDNMVDVYPNAGLCGSDFIFDQNGNTESRLPLMNSLRKAMRKAYEGKLKSIDIQRFNFENFNKLVKELLESIN